MTDAVTLLLAALGIVGQIALVLFGIVLLLRLVGVGAPLEYVRGAIWGYELWLAFVVSTVATLGSLFFSEIADYVPCELCWIQRIFMYPLALVTLPMALARDNRAARYLLPLPLLGAGFAVYHLLVENGVVEQSQACLVSAPGGCATKWIDEFGYITIPTLALTAFLLVFPLLLAAAVNTSAYEEAGSAEDEGDGVTHGLWSSLPAWVAKLLVVGLILGAGVVGWMFGRAGDAGSAQSSPPPAATTTDPGTSEPVGRAVFVRAGCGGCHALADAGSESSIGPNLDERRPSAEVVRDAVTNGRDGMPPFDEQLTTDEIEEVAAYVAAAAGG
jgi:disulfide bond formation protein DsbB